MIEKDKIPVALDGAIGAKLRKTVFKKGKKMSLNKYINQAVKEKLEKEGVNEKRKPEKTGNGFTRTAGKGEKTYF